MIGMQVVLVVLGGYALVGLAFGVAFVARGAGRLDPVARGAPVRVRLLFLPGALALWPLLVVKWRGAREGERRGASS